MISRAPAKLFQAFLNDFPEIGINWAMGWADWSDRLFKYLSNLGKKLGFDPYYKGSPREYLVDLCWYREVEKDYYGPHWMELACEVEFHDRDIEDYILEFWKLVDVKAYTKLFIYYPKIDEVDESINDMSELVGSQAIKFPEEQYLIIALTDTKQNFQFTAFEMNYLGKYSVIAKKKFPK